MANTFAPVGFRESREYGAAPPNYAMETFPIAYNYSTQIGRGDPVKLVSGYLNIMPTGDSNTILGIFMGCEYYDPVAQMYRFFNWWPAPTTLASSQVVLAKVITDRSQRFIVQVNSTTAVAQSNVGQNCDITTSSSGAPNTLTGISTCSLNGSFGTTSTYPFTVTGIVPSGSFTNFGNIQAGVPATYDATQGYGYVEVLMNKKSGVGML